MLNSETLLMVYEVVNGIKPSWTHKGIETCLVVLSFHRLAQHFFFFFLHMLIHRHFNSFSKLRNWKIVPQTKHPMLTLWDICTIKHYWQQVTGAVMQLLLYILQIHAEASFELARRGLIKCMSKFWKHSTIVSSTFTVPTHHCTLISHNIINTCLILCWSPCGQLLWDLWRCAVVSGTLM